MVHVFSFNRGDPKELEKREDKLYDSKHKVVMGLDWLKHHDMNSCRGSLKTHTIDELIERKKVNRSLSSEIQPNVRFCKFWNIEVPDGAEEQLLQDLGPFSQNATDSGSKLRNRFNSIIRFISKSMNLEPVPPSKNKRAFNTPYWRDHIIVFVLGKVKA